MPGTENKREVPETIEIILEQLNQIGEQDLIERKNP